MCQLSLPREACYAAAGREWQRRCAVGNLANTRLHLRVAVRAEQDALRRLCPGRRPSERVSPRRESAKLFDGAVAVVELERAGVSVVAADCTASARLRDQRSALNRRRTARDGLRAAPQAAVDASALEPKTRSRPCRRQIITRGFRSAARARPVLRPDALDRSIQPCLPQPVADRATERVERAQPSRRGWTAFGRPIPRSISRSTPRPRSVRSR